MHELKERIEIGLKEIGVWFKNIRKHRLGTHRKYMFIGKNIAIGNFCHESVQKVWVKRV